ncbi:transcription factor Adf-1-like [Euwallacea similis]|uniref:transcription factor Adf-1-like n=1 Tax=Euwallacea similis TaxID=1736056 RepID=UPI00344F52C5
MEWTREKCLQLIDEYEKHPVLWNPTHGSYYNKIQKNDNWTVIAEVIGCTHEEVKKKMESILSSFRREKAKGKKSVGTGKGRQEVYVSKWFAFPRMAFLLDKYGPVKAINWVEEEDIPNKQEPEGEDDSETVADEQESANTPQVIAGDEVETQVSEMTTVNTSECVTTQNRKNRRRPNSTVENSKIDETTNILKSVASNKQLKADECNVYGRHVANKLRSYTKRTRNMVQHYINNILFNADMGQYDNIDTRRPSTSNLSFGAPTFSESQSSDFCTPVQLFHHTPLPQPPSSTAPSSP